VDTPLDLSLMTRAVKATAFIVVDKTRDEVFDCTDEELLIEIVLGRFGRVNLDLENVDADELLGWLALAYGVAGAPSGGTSEVWTLVSDATSGTVQLAITIDNQRQTSAPIAFNAPAAAGGGNIQTILRAMPNVGSTGVTVTGGPLGTADVVVTFGGPLANRPINQPEILSALAGGTLVVNETTPGVGRLAQVTKLGAGLYGLPFTTFLLGYRGSTRQPTILKNSVVDSVECRAASRGKVNATVSIVGSGDLQQTVGYTMPECVDIEALRFGDTALFINGQDLQDPASTYAAQNLGVPVLKDWRYYYRNGVLTGDYAFPGRGIDVKRLHRATRRESGIEVGALGEANDALYTLADLESFIAAALHIGPSTKQVRINVPQGIYRFDDERIRHEGEGEESHLRTLIRPSKIKGDPLTSSNVEGVSHNSQMLVAA
jgi:hypothetical protein